MSATTIWAVIAGMALVNFLIRFPSLAVLSRTALPAWAKRWLSYIPVSAMATLVVGGVVRPDGRWLPPFANPYLWASIITGVVYWRFRSFLGATVVGVICFLAFAALLG
ncbi:MAG: AzlD domain-containing protein [Coriobacteriia bacterium]|nr:AzlD domain-containing protein [Coriobacteriia bacterium]MBN2839541.1 AzlD domain-containing protein [Coriobacteriia bacterium]